LSQRPHPSLSVCIGCGCDDFHACSERCWWAHVDVEAGLGVCSECPRHITRWRRGDRALAPEVVAARRWADRVVVNLSWRARTALAKLLDGLDVQIAELRLLERKGCIAYLDRPHPIREVVQAFNRKFRQPPAYTFQAGDPHPLPAPAADRRTFVHSTGATK